MFVQPRHLRQRQMHILASDTYLDEFSPTSQKAAAHAMQGPSAVCTVQWEAAGGGAGVRVFWVLLVLHRPTHLGHAHFACYPCNDPPR